MFDFPFFRPGFIGGAPGSGTTWLQRMLNTHPSVACYGEAHFFSRLLPSLEHTCNAHGDWLEGFEDPYVRPRVRLDPEVVLGFCIGNVMQQLAVRKATDPDYPSDRPKWVIEKTPSNAWRFDWILSKLPDAVFIYVVRDPRDAALSNWHAHRRWDPEALKRHFDDDMGAFVIDRLVSWRQHAEEMWGYRKQEGADGKADRIFQIRYESMEREFPHLLRWLGVNDRSAADIVEENSFFQLTGRPRGDVDENSHIRRGKTGVWRHEFSDELRTVILKSPVEDWILRYGYGGSG